MYKSRVKNIRYYEIDIKEPDLNRDAVHLNYLDNWRLANIFRGGELESIAEFEWAWAFAEILIVDHL